MEHWGKCTRCLWRESWTTKLAAMAAAVWHVFEEHPEDWRRVIGKQPPSCLEPKEYGRKLENWESQA